MTICEMQTNDNNEQRMVVPARPKFELLSPEKTMTKVVHGVGAKIFEGSQRRIEAVATRKTYIPSLVCEKGLYFGEPVNDKTYSQNYRTCHQAGPHCQRQNRKPNSYFQFHCQRSVPHQLISFAAMHI